MSHSIVQAKVFSNKSTSSSQNLTWFPSLISWLLGSLVRDMEKPRPLLMAPFVSQHLTPRLAFLGYLSCFERWSLYKLYIAWEPNTDVWPPKIVIHSLHGFNNYLGFTPCMPPSPQPRPLILETYLASRTCEISDKRLFTMLRALHPNHLCMMIVFLKLHRLTRDPRLWLRRFQCILIPLIPSFSQDYLFDGFVTWKLFLLTTCFNDSLMTTWDEFKFWMRISNSHKELHILILRKTHVRQHSYISHNVYPLLERTLTLT